MEQNDDGQSNILAIQLWREGVFTVKLREGCLGRAAVAPIDRSVVGSEFVFGQICGNVTPQCVATEYYKAVTF